MDSTRRQFAKTRLAAETIKIIWPITEKKCSINLSILENYRKYNSRQSYVLWKLLS